MYHVFVVVLTLNVIALFYDVHFFFFFMMLKMLNKTFFQSLKLLYILVV